MRENLLHAAARVIGDVGYRDASVQRITATAGVAQGTFYLHFPSRQDLFDQVLPHFGAEMLEHVRERVAGIQGFFEVEVTGLKAVFEFLSDNAWFWRLLDDARVEAPAAWARHRAEVARRYLRSLERSKADGSLKKYGAAELPTLVQFLMAARDHLYRSHLATPVPGKGIPREVLATYRKFIEAGLKD